MDIAPTYILPQGTSRTSVISPTLHARLYRRPLSPFHTPPVRHVSGQYARCAVVLCMVWFGVDGTQDMDPGYGWDGTQDMYTGYGCRRQEMAAH